MSAARVRGERTPYPPHPDLAFEMELWAQGTVRLAGIDEAGRGALAGPVAAAAVILPPDPNLLEKLRGVRDSKLMTPNQRQEWAARLPEIALAYHVGFAANSEIDVLGILPATHMAVRRALAGLAIPPQHLLLDYLELADQNLPQTALIHGDARCLSIAAASVLAKTARDDAMRGFDAQYPGYGFAAHKGYGTAAHLAALHRLGPCDLHRRSFAPLRL
jgi:ribonuclease HII